MGEVHGPTYDSYLQFAPYDARTKIGEEQVDVRGWGVVEHRIDGMVLVDRHRRQRFRLLLRHAPLRKRVHSHKLKGLAHHVEWGVHSLGEHLKIFTVCCQHITASKT